jgi:membrane-associated protease RseP (regulator of RpoE activity)
MIDDALKHKMLSLFQEYKVYSIKGETIIRGKLNPSLFAPETIVDQLARELDAVHFVEDIDGEKYLTFTISPHIRRKFTWKVNFLLFILTVISTLFAGAFLSGENPLEQPAALWVGIPFSATILSVLGLHELGHYLAAKRYKLNVTLPYFLPFPTIIGTLGAVIRMRSPIYNRRMLLDIGASGPIVGFIVSIPITIYGLMNSHLEAVDVAVQSGNIHLGSSLIFELLSSLALGPVPEGYDVVLNPVAFAGWVGFFVTSLNLLPIGQLDGGHIIYSLLGKKQKKVSTIIFILLIGLGVATFVKTGWPGWFLWAFFILFLAKIPHPPVVDENVPIGKGRRIVGIVTLIIFLLTFIPDPVKP